MKNLLYAIAACLLLAAPVLAASPVTINNAANTDSASITNHALNVNATITPGGTQDVNLTKVGGTAVVTGGVAGSQGVGGTSAAAATDDASNPVKVGGVYKSTPPTLTDGQRGNQLLSVNGAVASTIYVGATPVSGPSSGALGDNTSQGPALTTLNFPLILSATGSYDRDFTCKNSAAVNVTAGSTTQIVGLSGSTVIRVCSIAVSMSAAGTAGVYTGTGTNCGTGTTALIQDMTLATGTPLQISAANGSVVRSSAGGEICVKAVTGNVTGVISYAQY